METSGQLLRRARVAAGFSQRALAERFGCDKTLISAYENGRREPGADQLLRLLAAASARVEVTSSVDAGRDAAAQLEQVAALAMALPRRDAGRLAYPSFRTLIR